MTLESKRVFAAGEIDPALRTRLDAQAYQTGLKTLRNTYVKKTGGIRNRPGTRFICHTKDQVSSQRLIEFDFGAGDSYALPFSNNNIRVVKNQKPILEPAIPITGITKANPGVFTETSHGYAYGDEILITGETGMVEVNNRFYLVVPIDANSYTLLDKLGNPVNTTNYTTYVGGAVAQEIYEIGSPYAPADLAYLNYDQSFDTIKMASGNHPLQDLIRKADDNWTIANSLFQPSIAAPTGLTITHAGSASTWYVTAIKIGTGEESLAATITGAAPTSAAPQTFAWATQSNALFYKVYRSDSNGVGGLVTLVAAQASPAFIDSGYGPNYAINPTATQGTVFSFGFSLTKQPSATFPITALPGAGKAIAWHPSGDMIAVGFAGSAYLRIYSFASGVFTDITATAIAVAPLGQVNALAWSPDGIYLAVGVSNAEAAILYKRSGLVLTKNGSGFTQPTGNAFGVNWSSDSRFVCFAHAATPFLTVLSRTLDVFAKLTNPPGGLPPAQGNACLFLGPYPVTYINSGIGYSSTIHVLMIGSNNAASTALAYFNVEFNNAAFPGAIFFTSAGSIYPGVGIPANGNVLALSSPNKTANPALITAGYDNSNFVRSFLLAPATQTGAVIGNQGKLVFTAQADTLTPPTGAVNGIAETTSGNYVALATSGTAKLLIYDRISNVLVADPGTFTDLDGNGTAAAFSPDGTYLGVSEATTPYAVLYSNSLIMPKVVGFGQQRLRIGNVPAASFGAGGPDVEFDSAQNAYTNFTNRPLPNDSDAIQFRCDGRKLNQIMHLLNIKKLLQLTTSGIVVLEGDQNGTITPNLQNPRMTGYNGANHVRPALIGDTAIYVGATHNKIFDLKKEVTASSYFSSDNFFVIDLTNPSAHLFRGKKIVDMCYQESPDSIVWIVMDDGTVCSMTYVRDEAIVGFGRHDMAGKVLSCCCIRESSGIDRVYFTVDIGTASAPNKMVVALQDRNVTSFPDQFFVDCGVTYDGRNTQGNPGTLTYNNGTPLTITSLNPFFIGTAFFSHIRLYKPTLGANGKPIYSDFAVTLNVDSKTVQVIKTADSNGGLAFGDQCTQWSWLTNKMGGLYHLNGMNVSVLADGGVLSSPNNPNLLLPNGSAAPVLTVGSITDGMVNLGGWFEVVQVGLPYVSDIETLEMDVTQGPSIAETQKNAPRGMVKVVNSKGLFFRKAVPSPDPGTSAGFFKSVNSSANNQSTHDVVQNVPAPLVTGNITSRIDGDWNPYGGVFIRQVDPVPVEINAIFEPTAY